MPPAVAGLTLKRHSFAATPKQKVVAATGVPGTAVDLPAFLAGPEAAVRKVRGDAEKARTTLAHLVTNLQTLLPPAAAALAAVENAENGPQIAAADGFDVGRARELVDSLAKLLQGLK
jgi:hypothetical protein